jgi:hypothetical protein
MRSSSAPPRPGVPSASRWIGPVMLRAMVKPSQVPPNDHQGRQQQGQDVVVDQRTAQQQALYSR